MKLWLKELLGLNVSHTDVSSYELSSRDDNKLHVNIKHRSRFKLLSLYFLDCITDFQTQICIQISLHYNTPIGLGCIKTENITGTNLQVVSQRKY